MENSLKNIFAVSDLRNRVLFTLGMLGVYRLGQHIPTPGVNAAALQELAPADAEHDVRAVRHVLGREPVEDDDLRAGHHALHQRVDHPAAADGRLAVPREAVEGRRAGPAKITQYTRYGTIVLCVVQSLGIAIFLERRRRSPGGLPLVYEPGLGLPPDDRADAHDRHRFIMWLGEQITERGIGNGMSLIIFAGIVVGLAARGAADGRADADRAARLIAVAVPADR